MKLPYPCVSCGSLESHGYRSRDGVITCASCSHVRIADASLPSYRKQREKHAKDLLQPFVYRKGEGVVENRAFVQAYGKKKLESYKQFMKDQKTSAGKAAAANQVLATPTI